MATDMLGEQLDRGDVGVRTHRRGGVHLHASFAEAGYRRFLVNGILWTAGVEVPKGGAKVELDAQTLPGYLKAKPAEQN
jgi:hypothetical protein